MLRKFFISICELSISAGLPILIFIFAAPVLDKRFAAKWNYRIWIFLAIWLVIPFQKIVPLENFYDIQEQMESRLERIHFLQSQSEVKQSLEKQHNNKQEGLIQNDAGFHRLLTVAIPPQMTEPIVLKTKKHVFAMTGIEIAAVIWLCGSICFLGMHLYGCCHYKRKILRDGNLIKDDKIMQQFKKLLDELRIRKKITLIHYEKAESPLAIGFLHPLLVLPDESYGSKELFYILKHELVHLKRRDVYIKLLFVTVNALHWFNPIVRIMCRQASIDMELSCDEMVVRNTDLEIRKEYTETLYSTIHRQCSKKSGLSTQFYEGKKIMKKRFENILINTKKKNGVSMFICSAFLITLLGNLTGCSLTDKFSEQAAGSVEDNRIGIRSAQDNMKADREDTNGNAETDNENENRNAADNGNAEKTLQNEERQSSGNKAAEILAYITGFDADHKSLEFDEVEWVIVPSRRAAELGVSDSYAASGFYINNEEEKSENLTLAKKCECILLNWYASYEPMEVSVDEVFDILEERKENGTGIPYILTVKKNKIIKIEEHYVP